MNKPQLYIGLMSGTSLDGIDACIIDFSKSNHIIATHHQAFSPQLYTELQTLISHLHLPLAQLCALEVKLSQEYQIAVDKLMAKTNIDLQEVKAIGCHGQTIFHLPDTTTPFSLQIGSGAHLAEYTQTLVVNDFRNNDMALGGQGAPLVCGFHASLFSRQSNQLLLNMGGIANITWLPAEGPVLGFDTGPANALLDVWYHKYIGEGPYDADGAWASSADPDEELVELFLTDEYFKQAPPKSTGKEYFNLDWINNHLLKLGRALSPATVQASLAQLTVESIVQQIDLLQPDYIYLCGGGVKNLFLVNQLKDRLSIEVETTEALGIDPDFMEAAAFAWLAMRRLERVSGTVKEVTGASTDAISGAVYIPSQDGNRT